MSAGLCDLCEAVPGFGEKLVRNPLHGLICAACSCWYCNGTAVDPTVPLLKEPCQMCRQTGLAPRARLRLIPLTGGRR